MDNSFSFEWSGTVMHDLYSNKSWGACCIITLGGIQKVWLIFLSHHDMQQRRQGKSNFPVGIELFIYTRLKWVKSRNNWFRRIFDNIFICNKFWTFPIFFLRISLCEFFVDSDRICIRLTICIDVRSLIEKSVQCQFRLTTRQVVVTCRDWSIWWHLIVFGCQVVFFLVSGLIYYNLRVSNEMWNFVIFENLYFNGFVNVKLMKTWESIHLQGDD
jgi:hypothetical protein